MVAKIRSGKSMRGVLSYNENKVKKGNATCIEAHLFGCHQDELNFYDKLYRFAKLTDLNPKAHTNTLHISLNFDPSEKLESDKLVDIAHAYMTGIGFATQPFLVYKHTDAAHPHIHIVTTNVTNNGKRIDIHNLGRTKSEQIRKEIEEKFNLVRASSKEKRPQPIKSIPIDKVKYGVAETKASVSNVVRSVVSSYRFTSLPELNAVLRQYNVQANPGKEGSQMNAKGGLQYVICDEAGVAHGIPIKASAIYGKPTRANLEKKYAVNKILRQPYKEDLRKKIDQVLARPHTWERFQAALAKRNVNVVARINKEGRLYGLTFIDNYHKVVFNGSDLRKEYSAAGIEKRLTKEMHQDAASTTSIQSNTNALDFGDLLDPLTSLITPEETPTTGTGMFRKKKRRKKRRSI
jgi:hypothetical protein